MGRIRVDSDGVNMQLEQTKDQKLLLKISLTEFLSGLAALTGMLAVILAFVGDFVFVTKPEAEAKAEIVSVRIQAVENRQAVISNDLRHMQRSLDENATRTVLLDANLRRLMLRQGISPLDTVPK